MNFDKQRLFLNYLISNLDLFTKVNPILESKYFDPKLRNAVAFIKQHVEKYNGPPTPEQVKAETELSLTTHELTPHELAYAEKELETFCKEKAIEDAIIGAPDLLDKGDYGQIEARLRKALTISLQKNIGLDYFNDPIQRLKELSNHSSFSTGWGVLDDLLGGGLNKKEMLIISAPSGVGKSISMSNLGRNLCLLHKHHGVYYTFELSEPVVAKRLDSMFTGVAQYKILNEMTKVATELKKVEQNSGSIVIKRLPESTTTAYDLRAHLKEYELVRGYKPDFIIVDYLDLMASTQQVSVENQFIKDKYVAEELRAMANDYDLILITASQLNRGTHAIDDIEQLNPSHIAGGMSKINTADNFIAIYQNAQMKARGEMTFKMLKTRSSNGVGHHFIMQFDSVSLRMEVMKNSDEKNSAALRKTISSYAQRGRVAQGPSGPTEPDAVDLRSPSKPSGPSGSGGSGAPPRLNPGNLPFNV